MLISPLIPTAVAVTIRPPSGQRPGLYQPRANALGLARRYPLQANGLPHKVGSVGSRRLTPIKAAYAQCLSEIRTVAATFCPEGTYDNSPAFQRWVQSLKTTPAPSGAAETGIPNRSVAPLGLPALYHAKPSVETLGYSRMSLRDKSLLNFRKALRLCRHLSAKSSCISCSAPRTADPGSIPPSDRACTPIWQPYAAMVLVKPTTWNSMKGRCGIEGGGGSRHGEVP